MSFLVVDDNAEARESLAHVLLRRGLRVREVLVCELRHDAPHADRILFAGTGKLADAVRAVPSLGLKYVDLSADRDSVLGALAGASGGGKTVSRAASPAERGQHQFITVGANMRRLRARIARIAEFDSAVLISGESGTGKEVVAREIFHAGRHRRNEFVPVNCGAIPEHLVETELFGHKKGAFTDATADKKGLVEMADGGVLFLDEIGEMPVPMQARLLRFLDSGEFRRVGDPTIRLADVRVIAATNRPLQQAIATGRFRQDLFYRLNVLSLTVPPLRERKEDIVALAVFHLRRAVRRMNLSVQRFSDEALQQLRQHRWPGNVRELHNVVESATMAAAGDTITADEVRRAIADLSVNCALAPRPSVVEEEQLAEMLSQCGGNRSQAAAALGISRTTLWRRRRRMSPAEPT